MDRTATLMYLGGLHPQAMSDGSLDYLEEAELTGRLRKLREQDIETLVLGLARVLRG